MRQLSVVLASLVVAAAGPIPTSATAQENYRHGFIRVVEPGVSLQRATEVAAEEALPNLPFLPGDRVWSDAAGRAEFQFPEGTAVRLDRRSKLDYWAHDEGADERVVLRLWSGSLILRTRTTSSAAFEIETPGGLVQVDEPGVVRIDVDGDLTYLSVYEGTADLDAGQQRLRLAGGERSWSRYGEPPAAPEPLDRWAQDDFAVWDADREAEAAYAAKSREYLPEELAPYAPELETHGTWRYEQPVGYVWVPRVAVGWVPYTNGRWTWTPYGWTWVAYEPWGWAPFHYGRWGFSVSFGWYWHPGRVWSSAWVSWGVGGGYVGWCPLGIYNRPVVPWHRRGYRPYYPSPHRGYAVPRSIGHGGGWTVVRRGDLGRGDIAQRRVDAGGVSGIRVADSLEQRPDRTGGAFARSRIAAGAAVSRTRPGASSRVAGSAARGTRATPSVGFGTSSPSSGARATSRSPRTGMATSGLTGASARARSRNAPGAAAAAVSASRGTRTGTAARPGGGATRRLPGASSAPGSSSRSPADRSSATSSRRPFSRPNSGSSSRGGGVSTSPRSAPVRPGFGTSRGSSPAPSSGASRRPSRSPADSGSGVSNRPSSRPTRPGFGTSRGTPSRSSSGASRRSSGLPSSSVRPRSFSSGSSRPGTSSTQSAPTSRSPSRSDSASRRSPSPSSQPGVSSRSRSTSSSPRSPARSPSRSVSESSPSRSGGSVSRGASSRSAGSRSGSADRSSGRSSAARRR